MWTVFGKELFSFLDSLMAYVVMAAFLSSLGLLLWVFPETSLLAYGYADMAPFLAFVPMCWFFCCLRLRCAAMPKSDDCAHWSYC